jgi:hypothetical protein
MSDISDFWRKALEANPEVMAGIEEQRRELGFYDDEARWADHIEHGAAKWATAYDAEPEPDR